MINVYDIIIFEFSELNISNIDEDEVYNDDHFVYFDIINDCEVNEWDQWNLSLIKIKFKES